MTYLQICDKFRAAGIDGAEWDAELLLEHFCGVDRLTVRGTPARDYLSPALLAAVEKRAAREPLQYLLGEWPFYRQTYEVSPDCLIPRSDTEILVEEAIRRLPPNAVFADLCTGSGCIAISTLAERPDTRAVAVEKFAPTLALALRNAQKNGVADRLEGRLGDVLANGFLPEGASYDAILSNPPYIRRDVLSSLAPELEKEPRAALDGGADGLVFYRAILQYGAAHLRPNGFFLFEIGYDQAEALRELGEQAGFLRYALLRDYGGCDRVVCLAR